MRAANLFVQNMSSFCSFRKIILRVIRIWSSKAALNIEFYLSDWHFRLILFAAFLISNTVSDGDYSGDKNLGRSRPLIIRVNQVTESGLRNTRPSCQVSDIRGSPWKEGFSPSEKSNNIILISLLFSDKILVTVSKILLYSKLELYKLYEHYRLRKFQKY